MTANGNQKRLKGHDDLILALASGQSVKDAAAHAGVAERTAHRRLEDADTRAAVRRLRAQMIEQTTGRLTAAMTTAVGTLVEIAKNGESEQNRLSASRAVLDLGAKFYEQQELVERVEQLEERLDAAAGIATIARRG